MLRRLVLSLLALLVLLPVLVSAQVHVNGYTRRDGTYVAPHYRSSPNGSTLDNWSTRGNVNPYTGQYGTRTPLTPYTPLPTSPYVVLPAPPLSPFEAGYLVPRR
jgi:hypothetical protein